MHDSDERLRVQSHITTLVQLIVDEFYKGRRGDKLRDSLIASGIEEPLANELLLLTVRAGKGALDIKNGKSFQQALDGMNVPEKLKPFAENLLKAVYEQVKDRPDSIAGNPGRITVQLKPFILSNLAGTLVAGIPLFSICGVVVFIRHNWWPAAGIMAICFTGLILVVLKLLWRGTKRKFRFGNVCPGIVVSVKPERIAVLGNLGRGRNPSYNVIKIIEDSISRPTVDAKIGERVATVAVYKPGESKNHWDDFYPDPVYCATHDSAEINRVVCSIPEEQWKDLEIGLAQVADKTKTGIYKIS